MGVPETLRKTVFECCQFRHFSCLTKTEEQRAGARPFAIEKTGVHLAKDSPLSSEAGATATFPLAILIGLGAIDRKNKLDTLMPD